LVISGVTQFGPLIVELVVQEGMSLSILGYFVSLKSQSQKMRKYQLERSSIPYEYPRTILFVPFKIPQRLCGKDSAFHYNVNNKLVLEHFNEEVLPWRRTKHGWPMSVQVKVCQDSAKERKNGQSMSEQDTG